MLDRNRKTKHFSNQNHKKWTVRSNKDRKENEKEKREIKSKIDCVIAWHSVNQKNEHLLWRQKVFMTFFWSYFLSFFSFLFPFDSPFFCNLSRCNVSNTRWKGAEQASVFVSLIVWLIYSSSKGFFEDFWRILWDVLVWCWKKIIIHFTWAGICSYIVMRTKIQY